MNKHDRLRVSGLNSHFHPIYNTFSSYVEGMREIIEQARVDLEPGNRELIVNANAPREHKSSNAKHGILLIHGLFDSPHTMSCLYDHFANNNYVVRNVLLPGHGTRPGDLLEVAMEDFIECTEFAIDSFQDEVDTLSVMGYSTGAALALYHAFKGKPIDNLILFAPAIKIKNRLAFATNWHQVISSRYHRAKWFQLANDTDYAKYQSLPFNAIYQVYRLTRDLKALSNSSDEYLSQFMIASADDEVVATQDAVEFFRRHRTIDSQLILYRSKLYDDINDIEQRCSYYKADKILDFSHTCLAMSPDHPHYGRNGDYDDLLHYDLPWGKDFKPSTIDTENLYAGAVTLDKLRELPFKRLSYNPDYPQLVIDIENFINRSQP